MALRTARKSRSVCLVGGRQGPRHITHLAGDATPSGRGVRQEAGIARRGGRAHWAGKGDRMAHVARRGAAWIARRWGYPRVAAVGAVGFCVVCTRPIARYCVQAAVGNFPLHSAGRWGHPIGWSGRRGYTPHGSADVTNGHNAPRTEATRRPTTEAV